MTIEAYILAAADNLDATINQVRHAHPAERWHRRVHELSAAARAIAVEGTGDVIVCRRSPAAIALALLLACIEHGRSRRRRTRHRPRRPPDHPRALSRHSLAARRSAWRSTRAATSAWRSSSMRTPASRACRSGRFPSSPSRTTPVSPAREYAISAAGFWMQAASSEWILTRRPRLRDETAPLAKGILAFHVAGVGGVCLCRVCRRGTRRTRHALDGRRAQMQGRMGGRDGDRARGVRRVAVSESRGEMGSVGVACGENRTGGRRRQGSSVGAHCVRPTQAELNVRPTSHHISGGVPRCPSANVIVPSTTTLPSTVATPRSWPIRLRRRFTTASMITTSPGWTGRR